MLSSQRPLPSETWLHAHKLHIDSGQPHECSASSTSFGTLGDFLAPVAEGQTRHHGQCLGRAGKKVILGFKVRKVQILPTARTSKNFTLEKSRRRKREKLTLHPPMSLENPISQSGTLRSKGLQLPGFYLRSLPSRGMTILTSGWFFSRLFQEQFLLDLNVQFDFDYIVIGSMIS